MTSCHAAFETFNKAYGELASLPERMFTIRDSVQWNMPVHIVSTEAAPQAGAILDLIEGPKDANAIRPGGIKASDGSHDSCAPLLNGTANCRSSPE